MRRYKIIIIITLIVIIALVSVGVGLLFTYYIDISNPSIRGWQKKATKVEVLFNKKGLSAGYGQDEMLVLNDRKEIDSWMDLIQTKTRYGSKHESCKCGGNPWIKLYENDKILATITIHMGSGIRCKELGEGNYGLRKEVVRPLQKKCAELGIEQYMYYFPDDYKEAIKNIK